MHKNFFIHIGNHKTGTTAIQNFLHKNENRLKLNKIIYPEIGKTLQYSYNSHNIAWELNGDIRFEQQNKTLSDLYKFISQCNNSIIISSEDLQNLEFDEVKFNQFKNELKKKQI